MPPHIKHIKDITQTITTHLFLYIANMKYYQISLYITNMNYYQISLSKCTSLKNNENDLLKLLIK